MNKQINIEIKARTNDHNKIRKILLKENADFRGTDRQIDTYFHSQSGRFKLREGMIENSLIFYDREDIEGPKKSKVIFYHPQPKSNLKEVLTAACGIKIEVKKQREIYFINHIKFHLDLVEKLGSFIEIEVIDQTGEMNEDELYQQCDHYLMLFQIEAKDLITNSYSDMLIQKREK